MNVHRCVRSFLLSAAVLLLAAPVCRAAQSGYDGQAADSLARQGETDAPDSLARPAPLGPSDPVELKAFMDGLLTESLKAHHLAGATVAVVKGDSLFFAEGYGYADVQAKTPVAVGETLFRIGSVSKLFVWTAVMQLVQRGALDLDADVNTYLKDFQIPATYPEPITLKALMTHTAGFEDRVIGLFARDSTSLRPLGELLRDELPARVRPPGEVASYSNHGTGIAAYIVEQVSGLPWQTYVEQNILQPLGMEKTTFRQPVPAPLAADLSKGYTYRAGAFKEESFEYVPLAPVGAASATATDMARFMLAHLHHGRLGAAVVLDEATAREMQAPLFYPAPEVNPLDHGFYDMSRNGHRVIGHGGDTFWFHTVLALLPEYGVGLFVSFNSAGGEEAAGEALEAFMDRYYPPPDVPVLSPYNEAGGPARFAGSYRSVRYSHTTIAKLAAAFFTVKASVTDDGRLETSAPEVIRWVQTGPLAFREEDGLRTLAFREDASGDVTHLLFGPLPVMAFERIGWLASPSFQLGLAVVVLVMLLLSLVGWPLAAWIRRRHGYVLEARDRFPPAAHFAAWAACLVLVAFVGVLFVVLSDPNQIVYGVPKSLEVALWFPKAGVVLAALALIYTVLLWTIGWGRLGARLWYTLVTLAVVAFLGQLYYWNLLEFRL